MTRADWYAQHNGGGWRKARKPHRCDQTMCMAQIDEGTKYFDTRQVFGAWPKTKRICAACANTEIKEPK